MLTCLSKARSSSKDGDRIYTVYDTQCLRLGVNVFKSGISSVEVETYLILS